MNLQKIHDKIIERAIQRIKPEGYAERHHILPRSMGGTNDKNNLVYLTGREHCIIHLLLAKIYNNDSMWYALNCMTLTRKIKSRAYEIGRKKQAEITSIFMKGRFAGEKHHFFGKPGAFTGKKHTEKVKKQLSELASKKLGEKNPFFGKKHTQETKNKLAKLSSERNSGANNPIYGTKRSEETKEKIRQSRVGKYSGKNSPGYKGPIQATCLKTGTIKILIGAKEMEAAGFKSKSVYACVKGKRPTHKNHTFIRLPINAKQNTTTPVPAGPDQQGEVYPELGSVSTPWIGQDSNNLDDYRGAVRGENTYHSAKEGSGDSMGHGVQEVESLIVAQSIEATWPRKPKVIWVSPRSEHLSDKP